jgi:hypothetical protein
MAEKKSKWIRLFYYEIENETVWGYEGSIQNKDMLIEIFQRLNLKRENIDSMYVDDVLQSDEELDRIFKWYEDNLPEWRLRNEERKKAYKKAKRRN